MAICVGHAAFHVKLRNLGRTNSTGLLGLWVLCGVLQHWNSSHSDSLCQLKSGVQIWTYIILINFIYIYNVQYIDSMAGWPDYVVVTGAGSEDINGVFAIQEGFFHEDCPVYGSLSDFSLSVCQSPDDSGKLHWGWIIGQGGVPAYGSMSQKDRIPSGDWQCFQASPPGPSLHFIKDDPDAAAKAYLQEARQRASRAKTSNPQLAVTVEAFQKSMGPGLPWQQCAQLRVEVATLLHDCEQMEQALKQLRAAQELWPSCPEALLLKTRILRDALQPSEARLAARQCHMVLRMLGEKGGQIQKACERILQELGEGTVLPEQFFPNFLDCEDADVKEKASHIADLGPTKCDLIVAVKVSGCSMPNVDGVYEPSRVISNQFVVFENSFGFRLSLETMSRKNAGPESVDKGWVIGKGAVGFFNTASRADNGLPSGRWFSFPAASECTPPSCTMFRRAEMEDSILQVHNARLAGPSADASAVAAAASMCLKFLQRTTVDLWKVAFVLTELAGVFRQLGLHHRALEAVSKVLELCPGHWEAYLEAACIHAVMQHPFEATVPLRQLLTARPADGRAAAMLVQLCESQDLGKELEIWLKNHAESPLVAEYLAKRQGEKSELKAEPEDGMFADFQLEDQREEVHAHWTLPGHIRSKDVSVNFKQDWLSVHVQEQLLFEGDLAHSIRPSESSWTFSSPHLTVTLCKCAQAGKFRRWEVLQKEDAATRLQRLGGLPFEEKDIHWL